MFLLFPYVLSGLMSKFCLTFDLSWKYMKDFLIEYYGVSSFPLGSPREVLEQAYRSDLIKDDGMWLGAMKLRNNLAHDYNSTLAYKVMI